MFGGLKNLANLAGLMGQAGEIQGKMAAAKDRISQLQLEGTAGGDAVTVRITGDFRVTGVFVHQWLVESKNRELFEQLTTAAFNQAIQNAKEAAAKEMASLAETMNVPGLQEAMSKMGLMQ